MTETRHPHPLSGELYTPITPEIRDLLEQLHARYGSWRVVAYHTKTRVKVLRNIRRNRHAISMKLLDRIITETGVGRLNDFEWFTPDDLVKLGIWKPVQYVEGNERVQGDERRMKEKRRRRKNKHKNSKPE